MADEKKFAPAERFAPGEYIADEMIELGWSREHAATLLTLSLEELDKLLVGTLPVTPELAERLCHAIGPSAECWLNLQKAWDGR